MGTLIDRVHRELTEEDIEKIVSTYHEWRFDDLAWREEATKAEVTLPAEAGSKYADIPGFCKSASTEEIAGHGHVLTPGRYVGAEEIEEDGESFDEKMPRLVAELNAQFAESAKLELTIKANLKGLGYEI
jgi:type I restriction enzyme M protein